MMEFKITFAKFVVLLGTGLMSSQTVAGEEGPSLKGFQCYALDERRLNLSPQDVSSGKRLPPVFDARLVGVKRVGVEGDVIYVAWPLKTVNGFTQILRQRRDPSTAQSRWNPRRVQTVAAAERSNHVRT